MQYRARNDTVPTRNFGKSLSPPGSLACVVFNTRSTLCHRRPVLLYRGTTVQEATRISSSTVLHQISRLNHVTLVARPQRQPEDASAVLLQRYVVSSTSYDITLVQGTRSQV